LFSWKSISVTHTLRVCSLSYVACKAHAPYCIVICGLSVSVIFFPRPARFSEKAIENEMFVFIFSTTLFRNISRYKDKWARYHKRTCLYLCYDKIICNRIEISTLMKIEFSRKTFEKILNEFHENPSTGSSRVLPYRETKDWTDRHDKVYSHF